MGETTRRQKPSCSRAQRVPAKLHRITQTALRDQGSRLHQVPSVGGFETSHEHAHSQPHGSSGCLFSDLVLNLENTLKLPEKPGGVQVQLLSCCSWAGSCVVKHQQPIRFSLYHLILSMEPQNDSAVAAETPTSRPNEDPVRTALAPVWREPVPSSFRGPYHLFLSWLGCRPRQQNELQATSNGACLHMPCLCGSTW